MKLTKANRLSHKEPLTTGDLAPATARTSGRWFVLMVLCLGALMIVLDTTIVNVALPSIRVKSRVLRDIARLGRECLSAHLRRLSPAQLAGWATSSATDGSS